MALRFQSHFPYNPSDDDKNRVREVVHGAIDRGEVEFAKLPYQDDEVIREIAELAGEWRKRFKTFVIVGIGGSDLGARAAHRALNHQFYNLTSEYRMFFVGDTTDPVALEEVVELLSWQETGVVMISKSGNTVEQMATFLVLRDHLQQALGELYHTHIVTITDPTSGTLREITSAEGYRSLVHPPVGGRFSVLSAVGLFPLALAGIDIWQLLTGARWCMERHTPDALHYAAVQHAAYEDGKRIHVFMPYTYALREVGFWFRQLWAESLGKAVNLEGLTVNVGPTPVAALGPTDQHSQVQLYREGPNDKTFTFVTVRETSGLTVPENLPSSEGVQYLKGRRFQDILEAELAGTEGALQEVGRPTCRIELDTLDAEHLGALFFFFELATAYAGACFAINPYDQPGVERGKELMRNALGA